MERPASQDCQVLYAAVCRGGATRAAGTPGATSVPAPVPIEVAHSREARVGSVTVRRALPQRTSHTVVGSWFRIGADAPPWLTASS